MTYYYSLRLSSLPLSFQLPVNPPLQGGPGFLRPGMKEHLAEALLGVEAASDEAEGKKWLSEVSVAA